MAKRTTIHFNGDADPITVEEDFDSVKLAIGGSPRQTHDFVRVV